MHNWVKSEWRCHGKSSLSFTLKLSENIIWLVKENGVNVKDTVR